MRAWWFGRSTVETPLWPTLQLPFGPASPARFESSSGKGQTRSVTVRRGRDSVFARGVLGDLTWSFTPQTCTDGSHWPTPAHALQQLPSPHWLHTASAATAGTPCCASPLGGCGCVGAAAFAFAVEGECSYCAWAAVLLNRAQPTRSLQPLTHASLWRPTLVQPQCHIVPSPFASTWLDANSTYSGIETVSPVEDDTLNLFVSPSECPGVDVAV